MKNSINRRRIAALVVAFLLLQQTIPTIVAQQATAAASSPKRFELTVDSIMRGAALVGYTPGNVRWSQDGARVYFRWKGATEPRLKDMDTYVVNRDGTGLRKLSEEEAKNAPPASGDLSKDKKLTVFADEGDVYLYEHARGARRPLTRTTEAETNPRFTRDGRRIYFTRQNNLYVLSLDGGLLEQLTDIRIGGGGGVQARATESQEVLKKEERRLIEAVRERAERREEQEAKRKARERRKPFNVATGQSVSNLTLSPDGRFVVVVISEPATAGRQTIVPNYVTESAYTEDIPGRTKVGDAQGRTRMFLISVETGDARPIDHGQRAEAAPVVRTRTEQNATEQAERERGTTTPQAQQGAQTQGQSQAQQGQPPQQQGQQQGQQPPRTQTEGTAQATTQEARERDVQLFQLQWSDDGKNAAMLARSADNKDRWVLLLDPATGKTKTLASIHDDAWTGGPGAFTLGWLADNRRVYFVSEQDGFAHLYTVSIDGGAAPAQLTRGAFEVSDVRLSEDRTKFYFTSSEVSFAERHLYSMPVAGGARPTRLTAMPGNNAADISPDERMLAIVRSYSNKPPELYLAPSAPMSDAKQVTTSPIPEFFAHDWIEPPIVAIRARDGQTVRARLYKPARPNGAAVLFVHGAGYLQNVHNWWSSYYREYMFHHLLMERGYTVLDIDYRGSAGYGRDWRTGIYRHMGGKDLTDHVDAARYLSAEHNIDPKRIGIYGGSYGGFITLMAMFTTPDVFAAGAALRPVTDWAHYNHPYTSDILNLPQADQESYRRSSPIYFAEGLRGALLICHGMVDVNVHFQDSVRLAQRLIELRKENWELAPYPVEDHAFERETSWADEYKRILKLFTEHLRPGASASPAGQNVETPKR
ncbi:MAG TPA: alpha/beta fold hydrolase [Pyrinomonadaceae bacterium]|nr:alpha/beta fold hydrolase [Pyrinomonadaceae bacterium]